MEQLWAIKIQNGIAIIEIEVIYGPSGRPTQFKVTWKENGVAITQPKVYNN